jgi:hypothetical protein
LLSKSYQDGKGKKKKKKKKQKGHRRGHMRHTEEKKETAGPAPKKHIVNGMAGKPA